MLIKRNQVEIQSFLNDASNYKGYCEAVYFPVTTGDIQKILEEASGKKLNVTWLHETKNTTHRFFIESIEKCDLTGRTRKWELI